MNEEELLQWINSLPVSVQQSMMQYMMAGGDPNMGGTAPFGAGPMNTGRLGGELQGPLGLSPYDPMSAGAAYAYTPQLDAKGNEQPFDLGTAQQNLNLVQDQQGNLFNNAFMMQGGEGVYAPGTFDAMPQAPGEYDMLIQNAMGYGPTTYQGFIADRIAKGDPPDIALSNFWAVANDPGNPASAQLLASLPPKYVQQENQLDPKAAPRMVQVEGGDMQKLQEFAQQLAEAKMTQVPTAPEYGAVAQDFIDKGIPFPTERYGQGQYSMESQFPSTWGAGGMSAITQAQQNLENARAAAQPQAIQQAQAKYLTGAREESAGPAPTRGATRPMSQPDSPGVSTGMVTQEDMDLFNKQYGADATPSPQQETGGITVAPPPLPEMEPTTTGRSANRVVATTMSPRSANRSIEGAQNQLADLQRAVYTPEARRASTRNRAMNQLGRTPTQDTLMARQLVNYMMGAYGPRG